MVSASRRFWRDDFVRSAQNSRGGYRRGGGTRSIVKYVCGGESYGALSHTAYLYDVLYVCVCVCVYIIRVRSTRCDFCCNKNIRLLIFIISRRGRNVFVVSDCACVDLMAEKKNKSVEMICCFLGCFLLRVSRLYIHTWKAAVLGYGDLGDN